MLTDRSNFSGYTPEKDSQGKEKWPIGDEAVWKDGLRDVDAGERALLSHPHSAFLKRAQMSRRSPSRS
jgi:starch phosphorylase